MQLVDPASGEVPVLHLALADATGDSAIFEYIDGEMVVHHDREFKVMTNSPSYDQQLELLKNIKGFGGDQPVPGTTLASDRFERAAYYLSRLAQPTTQLEAIAAMFSIIRNAAQPFRVPDPGSRTRRRQYGRSSPTSRQSATSSNRRRVPTSSGSISPTSTSARVQRTQA